MTEKQGHRSNSISVRQTEIGRRKLAYDDFTTPPDLARSLLELVRIEPGSVVLDPCRGSGSFFNAFPEAARREWCEIKEGRDFFQRRERADWVISNPPYSILDRFLARAFELADVGVAMLLLGHHVTPRRLEQAAKLGFSLSVLHVVKVRRWFGHAWFLVWTRNLTTTTVSHTTGSYGGMSGAWIARKERRFE